MSALQHRRNRQLSVSVLIPDRKHDEPVDFEQAASPGNGGNLSPDLQPATPPTYPIAQHLPLGTSPLLEHPLVEPVPQAYKIGNYILVQQTDTVGDIQVFRAFHCDTREEYVCKVRWLLCCLCYLLFIACLLYYIKHVLSIIVVFHV